MKTTIQAALKIALTLATALALVPALSACDRPPWDDFEIPDDWEPSNYQLEESLVYDGSPIQLTMLLGGFDEASELGVWVFIDGIFQVYHTEADQQDTLMHTFQLAAEERGEFVILITPNTGTAGQTLCLGTVVVKNPFATPSLDQPALNSDTWLAGTFGTTLQYAVDAKPPRVTPSDAGRLEEPPRWRGRDQREMSFPGMDNVGIAYPVKDGDRVKVTCPGDADKDFRLYLFTNMSPQTFANGEQYANVFRRDKKDLTFDIDLDLSAYRTGEPILMFGLLIPLPSTEDTVGVVTSYPTITLVKE